MPKKRKITNEQKFKAILYGTILMFVIVVALFVVALLLGENMGDSWILIVLIGILVIAAFLFTRFGKNILKTKSDDDDK